MRSFKLPLRWNFENACKIVTIFVALTSVPTPAAHEHCLSWMGSVMLWRKGYRSDFCQAVQTVNFSEWRLSESVLLSSGLPLDDERRNYVRTVPNAIFSIAEPTPLKTETKLVAISQDVLVNLLDLRPGDCEKSSDFMEFVSGCSIFKGSIPLTHRYGGHQFGSWAGQLGDGRAHLLGEYRNKRGQRFELQLKGSGKTPYSRRGDGRAVLRSSVREFLCSEALHNLGIKTSRSASLVVSDDPVIRDQFYNGNVKAERAAVVLRVAPSWFRIGSLEILESYSEIDLLRELVDFIIHHHLHSDILTSKSKFVEFYRAVFRLTIATVAKWMTVGFAHGVCNTDNFSLLGLTIDFGPFGFVEEYDPDFIPNTSDDGGLYRFGNQPRVAKFNLDKLRVAISPLLDLKEKEVVLKIYQSFELEYQKVFNAEFRNKLGLFNKLKNDNWLFTKLLSMMRHTKSDFTMTFRDLSELPQLHLSPYLIPKSNWALKDLSDHKDFAKWIKSYRERLSRNPANITDLTRMSKMQSANPRYVLRNWMAEQANRHANKDDFSVVRKILKILQNPYSKQSMAEESGYADRRPAWADNLKVSCSS